jgi:hypothetical protein
MVSLALGPSLFRSQHFDELRQQVAFFLPNEHEIIFSSTTNGCCLSDRPPRGSKHRHAGCASAFAATRSTNSRTAPRIAASCFPARTRGCATRRTMDHVAQFVTPCSKISMTRSALASAGHGERTEKADEHRMDAGHFSCPVRNAGLHCLALGRYSRRTHDLQDQTT